MAGVAVPGLLDGPAGGELLFGVLADRFQHRIAAMAGGSVRGDERLADQ